MPPPGRGVHHYHFKLYALDRKIVPNEPHIENPSPNSDFDGYGFGFGVYTKTNLLKKMSGHILATAELVGTYERK
jgi:phosphatidylethanolamine-binding protein (PEBP) family uncharacterized protein